MTTDNDTSVQQPMTDERITVSNRTKARARALLAEWRAARAKTEAVWKEIGEIPDDDREAIKAAEKRGYRISMKEDGIERRICDLVKRVISLDMTDDDSRAVAMHVDGWTFIFTGIDIRAEMIISPNRTLFID